MAKNAPSCPRCGDPGRSLPASTPAQFTKESVLALREPWFCRGEGCEVVYFDASGLVVTKDALRVQVFQKERDPERLVCYCFRHSVRDVEVAAAEAEGENRVVEAITAACRSGLDRCEELNPQGRCCLGNIRRVAKLVSSEESCQTCR